VFPDDVGNTVLDAQLTPVAIQGQGADFARVNLITVLPLGLLPLGRCTDVGHRAGGRHHQRDEASTSWYSTIVDLQTPLAALFCGL